MDGHAEVETEVAEQLAGGRISWEQLVAVSSRHLVTPALYTAFRRHGVLPLLPPDLSGYLESMHALNLGRNQNIIRQAQRISELLSGHGLEPVFLKGAGRLLQGLYPDYGDRIMVDMDLLIPEPDTGKAFQLLCDAGYAPQPGISREDYKRHHHLPGLYHPGEVAFVELHREPVIRRYRKFLPAEAVIARKLPIPGMQAWVPAPYDQMLHLFLHDHLAPRQSLYGSVMLKGLYDYVLLSREAKQDMIPDVPGFPIRKYHKWRAFAQRIMHEEPPGSSDRRADRFEWYMRFLANHRNIGGIYRRTLYCILLLPVIAGLLVRAPFDQQVRRKIIKRISVWPQILLLKGWPARGSAAKG